VRPVYVVRENASAVDFAILRIDPS
jgi:hypothetical protein